MKVQLREPLTTDYSSDIATTDEDFIRDYVVSGEFIDTLEQEYLDYLATDTFNIQGFYMTEDEGEEEIDFVVNVSVENLTVGTIPLNSEPVTVGAYTVKFVIDAD